MILIAEAAAVCGDQEGLASNWLCELVLEQTGNEALARVSGFGTTLIRVAIILVAAFLISLLVRRWVTRFAKKMEGKISQRLGRLKDSQKYRVRRFQRLQAIAGVLRGALAVVIWLTALLMVIATLGFPLQPILAGAGLAGIVLGFGAQQLVRDILAGIAMLIEDQYGVGDWIEVEGQIGLVERVGLRSSSFRDIDGVLHHVLNGYIQRVGNLSQEWARATFDVPVSLDADLLAAKQVIYDVANELANDPVWGPDIISAPEIWGVQEFGPDGIKVRLVLPTKPMVNFDVTRQLRERMKLAFDAHGIRMPAQQVDLGGMRTGFPVATSTTDRQGRYEADPDSTSDGFSPRDMTDELRIKRGDEVRPD
ncbi:MAG: mechanosensitive ion channel family protein [Nitriliruptor sp.]|nr:MAG: mechanosensitive ion channel family protein [Nitriliruptor sp.]